MATIEHPAIALRGELLTDVAMARHCSWRAGGLADRFYTPADLDDLCLFLRTLAEDEPICFLGLGSNLLVRDGGWHGTVIHLHGALRALRIEDGLIYAEAGVASPKLARFAANHDLTGAEFLAGIPGTLGGALAMNAGCHGSETWEKVIAVLTVDRRGELRKRLPGEYEIGYRHVALSPSPLRGEGWGEGETSTTQSTLSVAQAVHPHPNPLPEGEGAMERCARQEPVHEWFVAAWLRLTPGDGAVAREEIKRLLAHRVASQPLDLPNAGSVFRNPPGDHAGRLIEACGLKGLRVGNAQVSEKHANFVVNLGGATATAIEELIDTVEARIEAQTGIRLHREVRIIGERSVGRMPEGRSAIEVRGESS